MKKLILSLNLVVILALVGCAGFDWKNTIPFIEPAVQTATSAVLKLAVNGSDRTEKINMIFASAQALRTLSGGEITQNSVEDILNIWLPDKAHWSQYASSISGIYAQYFAKLKGDPKAIAQAIEQLALGIETAAKDAQ